MTIEPLQSTTHGGRAAPTGNPGRPLPSARTSPEQSVRTPSCVSVQDIGDAEGPALLFALRRRGVPRIVVLARRASRGELPVLLAGGVRGVIAGQILGTLIRGSAAPVNTLPDLSAREVGVLKLVADGMSNRRIGEELGLSALTVKSHLARISRKLGTGDRAELVAKVMRAGLIT